MLFFSKKKETKTLELAKTLTFEAHRIVDENPTLHDRLVCLAALLHRLLPITGALAVAYDGEGEVLDFGVAGPSAEQERASDSADLLRLKKACEGITTGPKKSIETTGLAPFASPGDYLFVKPLRYAERHYATLALTSARPLGDDFSGGALDICESALAWMVQSYLADSTHRLNSRLQELVSQVQFGSAVDLQKIVRTLARLLRADAITLLIRRQGRLYLSATTDTSIRARESTFPEEKTLTARILESEEPVRLFNANDAQELYLATGLTDRRPGVFAEKLLRSGHPHHFLGVRLSRIRSQFSLATDLDEAFGALRIVRRRVPFATYEGRAMTSFAESLGSLIGSSWEHFINERLWQSRTEGIAVSRYEPHLGPDKKTGTPKIVATNEGFAGLVGASCAEIQGADARVFYADGEYDKLRRKIASAISDGRDHGGPYETTLRTTDGALKDISISYRIFSSPFVSPPAHYTASIIRDRTDEARRENRLRNLVELLDEMGLAYFRANLKGETSQTSEAESRILRYPQKSLLGMPRVDLYASSRDHERLFRHVQKERGRLVETMQRLKRSDGEIVFAKGVIRLLRTADGSTTELEGLYEDVSARMHLQDFLGAGTERLLEDAELSRKIRQDAEFNLVYMTTLSHQIQTPLTALAENLKNLRKGVDGLPKDSPQIAYIIGQIKTCTRLAANLSFIDLVLREKAFEFEKCNITQLCISECLNFRHLLKQERKRLIVDDESLDRYLGSTWGNPMLLKQVLFNLIDNAIKYSKEATAIRIYGKASRFGGLLEISNHGIPISKKNRRRVFDRGFRTKKARAYTAGTGLGLWLVEMIIKAHRGWIQCDSTPATKGSVEGVVFRIFLPEKKPNTR